MERTNVASGLHFTWLMGLILTFAHSELTEVELVHWPSTQNASYCTNNSLRERRNFPTTLYYVQRAVSFPSASDVQVGCVNIISQYNHHREMGRTCIKGVDQWHTSQHTSDHPWWQCVMVKKFFGRAYHNRGPRMIQVKLINTRSYTRSSMTAVHDGHKKIWEGLHSRGCKMIPVKLLNTRSCAPRNSSKSPPAMTPSTINTLLWNNFS